MPDIFEKKHIMKEKNDLMIIQNFSSKEFTKYISEIIIKEIEVLKSGEKAEPAGRFIIRHSDAR